MPKLRIFRSLLILSWVLNSQACTDNTPTNAYCRTEVEEILDEVLKYEFWFRIGCNQAYDDYFDKDTISQLFFPLDVPPFDTMPCYTYFFMQGSAKKTFLERQCVVVRMGVLDSAAISELFPPQSISRANVYLGDGKKVLNKELDCGRLDFSQMGGSVLCGDEPCERRYASPDCSFSDIYVDASGEKAIVYMSYTLGSWQKLVIYFQKFGEKWFLAVKENATSYDKDYE